MIEGGVILLVFAVSVLIFIGARVGAAGARRSPQEEMAHLQERLAWHEGQLQLAREKKWDDVMVGQIMDQLTDTRQQLLRLQAAPGE
jgi:hypothetical protein